MQVLQLQSALQTYFDPFQFNDLTVAGCFTHDEPDKLLLDCAITFNGIRRIFAINQV